MYGIGHRTFSGDNVQVLEVSAGERNVSDDLNLAITNLGDLNRLAKVAYTALNLDPVVQELLEGGDIEDLVVGGLRSIDDVLYQLPLECDSVLTRHSSRKEQITYLLGDLLLLAFGRTGLSIIINHPTRVRMS